MLNWSTGRDDEAACTDRIVSQGATLEEKQPES
jgi:hypothetical protein